MLDSVSPLCPITDGVEDTEHYFLLCHIFNANRLDLLSSVNVISLSHGLIHLSNEELLKIILCGHEQLSFDSTLEYIQASKRFE